MQLYSHPDFESIDFAGIDYCGAFYVSNYEALFQATNGYRDFADFENLSASGTLSMDIYCTSAHRPRIKLDKASNPQIKKCTISHDHISYLFYAITLP